MKQAFVIMPYGKTEEEKKHFDGVYLSIISPSVMKAGYTPKRSDIAGEPGSITHDVIRDLAESDVVVADLTSGNANVFFELGIRHAFRKCGTVHIISKSHELPFDVRQYRAISYSIDLAEIPQLIDQIAGAITKRMVQLGHADNPVHDAIPELPLDIRTTGDAALQEQIKHLQVSLDRVQQERDSLHQKLVNLDPSRSFERTDQEIDVDALLDDADSIMKQTGEHALLRLQNALTQGGKDLFAQELREVLKSPYLDQNDFLAIVKICRRLGLDGHRRATLEVAVRRYPFTDPLFLGLVDAYDDSPNPEIKDRGRLMIEKYLDIGHQNGKPIFTKRPTGQRVVSALGLLFNFYNKANQWEWVLSIAESAEGLMDSDALIERNKARALTHLGRTEDAERSYQRAIGLDPSNDTTLMWYSDFLDDEGRYQEAYEQAEKAILADPEDGSRYAHLAISILNRGLVRDTNMNIVGPIPRAERLKNAVPLFWRAIRGGDAGLIQRVVGILVRADGVAIAKSIQAGEMPKGDFETASLDYLVSKIEGKTQPSGNGPDAAK